MASAGHAEALSRAPPVRVPYAFGRVCVGFRPSGLGGLEWEACQGVVLGTRPPDHSRSRRRRSHSSARGNAPGIRPPNHPSALKGRHSPSSGRSPRSCLTPSSAPSTANPPVQPYGCEVGCEPRSAPSGRAGLGWDVLPGRCPGLTSCCAFGAEIRRACMAWGNAFSLRKCQSSVVASLRQWQCHELPSRPSEQDQPLWSVP